MKLDRFLQFFVVKEKKFYPLFIEQAEYARHAAQGLHQLLQETDHEAQATLYKEIKTAESNADKTAAKVYDELRNTFVTPFDREDINHLSSHIDTFIDFMHDSARRVVMYRPHHLNNMVVLMGKYIQEDADLILEMMRDLEHIHRKAAEFTPKCQRIHEIEHACDDLYEQIMEDTFANETDAIELVRIKNIVQALEDTTDCAKEVMDSVRAILIKSV